MLKIENVVLPSPQQWKAIIRGMRNPKNSWDNSDSRVSHMGIMPFGFEMGEADIKLMKTLCNAGTDHRKFMRMIPVYLDVTAPLYWWKEFDAYKVGTVANSCSTMHKIHAKEFTLDDFSTEHLIDDEVVNFKHMDCCAPAGLMYFTIKLLNLYREKYLETKDKKYWWQMIQLLPSSYNQKRTIMMNYEVLTNIYKSRRTHKLDCWHTLCDWIETLPYHELICGPDFLRKKVEC